MKKLLSLIALLLISFTFSACGGSVPDLCKKNLSEVRYNVFSGETEFWTASFMSGEREEPYIINGKSENKTNFGLLTITFKDKNNIPLKANYKITINDNEKTGTLEYNRYENNFMVDIKSVVQDTDKITVSVIVGEISHSTELICKNKDFQITWQTALNIAISELENKIKENTKSGILNGEMYVKIITDLNGNFDDYFWYVSLYTTKGDTYAIIINPITAEIMAQK